MYISLCSKLWNIILIVHVICDYDCCCVQEGGDDYCEMTDAGALGTGSTGYVWQPSAGTIIIAID